MHRGGIEEPCWYVIHGKFFVKCSDCLNKLRNHILSKTRQRIQTYKNLTSTYLLEYRILGGTSLQSPPQFHHQ